MLTDWQKSFFTQYIADSIVVYKYSHSGRAQFWLLQGKKD